MKLLIIEDEKELLDSVVKYFQGAKYVCEVASTYKAALKKVDLYDYDCILLDSTGTIACGWPTTKP